MARLRRPDPGTIPVDPGVYRFRDEHGAVIYVGKAKNLRQRLSSYFAPLPTLHQRTATMVSTAAAVDWVVVGTEVEALQLEYSWIKAHDPRFNVRYRDDKSYPYLAVTVGQDVPRVLVMRGAKRRDTRYFGPYAHAWAIRETMDLLLRVFPMRSCSDGVFRAAAASGRPCLLADIGKCAAPCVGRVSAEAHRSIVDDFCAFVGGRHERFLAGLERDMRAAAAAQDYERAALLRDDLNALRRALERSTVVLPEGTDADVVAMSADDLQASVQIFHVRGGRVVGQRGFGLDRTEDLDSPGLLAAVLTHHYGGAVGASGIGVVTVPREILVAECPAGADLLQEWLGGIRGTAVRIRVPQRGDKRTLLDTVQRNAEQALERQKASRSADLSARSLALRDLQDALGLPAAPLRIEAYDVSHLHGTGAVASMVVFDDALPRRAHYRTFTIKDAASTDDTRALGEVMRRRFKAGVDTAPVAAADDTAESPARPSAFTYRPGLLVVDGGAPQVRAVAAAMADLGVDVPVVGLAKRLEEVWLPDDPDPVILPRTSEALYLLQRMRDEAHRFALRAQRGKRTAAVRRSALDDIPGLGPKRRAALVKQFGSVRRLRAATADDIAEVPGIGPALAATIVAALAQSDPTPGVNVTTGEIVQEVS